MFFIMNIMLAIIYSNFKSFFEQQIEDKEEIRLKFFVEQFNTFSEGKDYLNEVQMFKCFLLIHSLANCDNKDKLSAEELEFVEAELQKSGEAKDFR